MFCWVAPPLREPFRIVDDGGGHGGGADGGAGGGGGGGGGVDCGEGAWVALSLGHASGQLRYAK